MDQRQHRWRTAAGWVLLAAAAGTLAAGWRVSTAVEVFSSGGDLELRVDDCAVGAPIAIGRLDAVAIAAGRSVAPLGGTRLEVVADGEPVLDAPLPRRFDVPGTGPRPVADWWLDERAAYGEVWRRPAPVSGPFALETRITGRALREVRIHLEGEPGATVSFRRGLINDDLFIHDHRGVTVAAGSLDPRPAADLRHALSQLLAGLAVAAGLLAVATASAATGRRQGGASAPRADRREPRAAGPLVAALAATAAATSAWLAGDVLAGLPHQPDGVVSLLQARWLLDGRLWWPVTALQPWLDVPFTYVVGDRWIGHHPHGWPALMAPAVAAGAPWLAGCLLGGLQVVLVHRVGRRLLGPRTAVLAAAFAAVSPIALLQAASWMSHVAASCLVLVAVLGLLAARSDGRGSGAVAAGLALGVALGVRPLVAVAAAAACGAVLLRDLARGAGRPVRTAAAMAAGGIAATLPVLAVNAAVTGDPLSFPYTLASGTMFAGSNVGFGLRHLDTILAHLGPALLGWGWPVIPAGWTGPLALGVCALPLLSRRPRPAVVFLAGFAAILAAVHLGARGHGLHGFGPRYWFEAFPALWLLAACGLRHLAAAAGLPSRRAAALAGAVLVTTTAAGLPWRLAAYRGYNWVDRSLVEAVERAGLGRGALLLTDDRWIGWGSAAPYLEPPPDARLLVLQGPGHTIDELRERTRREVWVWDGAELRRAERAGPATASGPDPAPDPSGPGRAGVSTTGSTTSPGTSGGLRHADPVAPPSLPP